MNPTENASVNIFVQLSIYTCAVHVHVHVHVRYLFFAGFVFFHLAVLNFTGELARSCIKLSAEEGNRVGRCSCQLLFKFFILFSEFLFQFFFFVVGEGEEPVLSIGSTKVVSAIENVSFFFISSTMENKHSVCAALHHSLFLIHPQIIQM